MFSESSSSASSQDGSENDQYQSLIVGDETPEDVPENLAQEIASMTELDQLRNQLSRFSSELISVTSRLSELSAEKLQVEFESRELKSKIVPVQIAKKSLEDENIFLKNQLQEFWAEIEKLTNEKNSLYKDRCDSVRQLNDEIALLKSAHESAKSRLDISETEREKSKQELIIVRSEFRAHEERFSVERTALNARIDQQSSLISNLESQLNVENSNRVQSGFVESKLSKISHDLAEARQVISERDSRISELETEKENLLSQLVGVKAKDSKTKKQLSIVSDILGRTSWNLSDIVDELSNARKDVISKRREIDQLTNAIEEMKAKVPMIEEGFMKLETAEEEIRELRNLNDDLKSSFTKMADEIDSLKFERIKNQTESQSLRIRNSELTKQVAGLIHENEVFRSKQGFHAGLGRSTPALTAAAPLAALPSSHDDHMTSSSAKRRKSSIGNLLAVIPSEQAAIVPHFRTVHDLVEQNSQLKDRLDNLLNECETEAQLELSKLRNELKSVENLNSELMTKRSEDRLEFDRILDRLEKDLAKNQSENNRLKALIQYTGGNVEMVDESVAKELVPVLQNQIQSTRNELNKHISLLNAEMSELKRVHAETVQQLDKTQFESSKLKEGKNFVVSQLEQLKKQSMDVFDRNKDLHQRLNLAESAKDNAEMKSNELSTKLMLNEKLKRELEMKVSGLQSTVAAMETAYKELVTEKESQSALLIGYHERLQKETDLYMANSETLKNLYTRESDKYNERLNFYQSAYEEQVKRSNELSALLARVESDLAAARVEKNSIAKQAEEIKVRTRLSEVSQSTPTGLTRDVARLETQLKLTEEDLSKYKDLAKLNEQLVEEKERQVGQLEETLGELRLELDQVRSELEHAKQQQFVVGDKMDIEPPTSTVMELVPAIDPAEVDRLREQVSNLEHAIVLQEKRIADESDQKHGMQTKLNEALKKISHLEDSIRSERLIISAKESQVTAEHVSANSRLEILEKERSTLEQRIELLRAENEKYLAYFASDLNAEEKAERGSAVIEQLKESIKTTALKESQLLMDIQRSRNTVELLTRESMGLKSLVAEREKTINELLESKLNMERDMSRLDELEKSKLEREAEMKKLSERMSMLEHNKTELVNMREKLTLSESNLNRLKNELETVSKQSQEYKRLHQELVEKMAVAGTEMVSKEVEQKLTQENAQLEKAKSQLTQTVGKLREEAREKIGELAAANDKMAKIDAELKHAQKEIVRQEGLMKLKDKRISELEGIETVPSQVMDLLDEYQGLVTRLANPTSKPVVRESVYHDANDDDNAPSDQQMD